MASIVYSTQKASFQKGKAYRNPRYWDGVVANVHRVYVIGNWPAVVKAYEDADIEVVKLAGIHEKIPDDEPRDDEPRKPKRQRDLPVDPVSLDDIEIPDEKALDKMNLAGLRELALSIDPEADFSTKREARAIIDAEIERRENAE